jgi:hypothetical protein
MPLHFLPGLQNNKVSIFYPESGKEADRNFCACLAEIDRLRKATQSMAQDAKRKEIKRPLGPITNLQEAMGLENNRAVYMNCRVSFFFLIVLSYFNINILIY